MTNMFVAVVALLTGLPISLGILMGPYLLHRRFQANHLASPRKNNSLNLALRRLCDQAKLLLKTFEDKVHASSLGK